MLTLYLFFYLKKQKKQNYKITVKKRKKFSIVFVAYDPMNVMLVCLFVCKNIYDYVGVRIANRIF